MNEPQLFSIKLQIARERLRQAKHSFNTALGMSIAFTSFSLAGAMI